MEYILCKANKNDLNKLIGYKLNNILKYADNLSNDEIINIKNDANDSIIKNFKDYKMINVCNKNIGCLLVTNSEDGILLEEIYIENNYQNQGIGSRIIKDIMKNSIVYLWVYKDNKKALSLYERLGFKIIKETEFRYYMKYIGE